MSFLLWTLLRQPPIKLIEIKYKILAICDHNGRFTHISANWPGSSHDSFIIKNGPVWKAFENGQLEGIILADSGYATRRWLLTPYPNPDLHAKKPVSIISPPYNLIINFRFNSSLAKTRVTIECAFGKFKRRFHCLHSGLRVPVKNCCRIIIAAAVLNNIAIERKLPDFDEPEDNFFDEQPDLEPYHRRNDIRKNNFSMRNIITENFFAQ